ncbi:MULTISPECIES: hypothetical protein [unclassified Methylocystis]|uniref:hypothetical protein n=1 Tax=unclassified Methylocystis TaxID=2625913 RepID=UPI00192181BC|nr:MULTISPECIES: hypothetical protein [unclassified Methylocystis]MBL1256175.1 hypothetical protein [Methylocystis sp. Sn-Cys]MDJ0448121.1 hypothetical protein [Methylocystis sp. JR02]
MTGSVFRRVVFHLALFCLVGATSAFAAPREHDQPAEFRVPPYSGILPLCSDPLVLTEITSSFGSREAEYWNSGLVIEGYESASEFGYRTDGLSYIPRRYCRAEAYFNDGKRRRVVYNIGEDLGFIGIGSGVTWCVEGLDRNHAFSPNCRAAGP